MGEEGAPNRAPPPSTHPHTPFPALLPAAGQVVQNEVTAMVKAPPKVIHSMRKALSVTYIVIGTAYFAVAIGEQLVARPRAGSRQICKGVVPRPVNGCTSGALRAAPCLSVRHPSLRLLFLQLDSRCSATPSRATCCRACPSELMSGVQSEYYVDASWLLAAVAC